MLNGTRLHGALKPESGLNKNGLGIYAISPADRSLTWQGQYVGTCSSGGYAAVQDRFGFVGLSSCVQKVDLNTLDPVSPAASPWTIGVAGVP